MIIDRKELMNLRDELDRLTEFIRLIELGELPYFYKCFDTMKNNIQIYSYVGTEEIEDFFPILERDWKASHTELIGVQEYDLSEAHPGIEPVLCLYFAGMLAEVGKYFDRDSIEFISGKTGLTH